MINLEKNIFIINLSQIYHKFDHIYDKSAKFMINMTQIYNKCDQIYNKYET